MSLTLISAQMLSTSKCQLATSANIRLSYFKEPFLITNIKLAHFLKGILLSACLVLDIPNDQLRASRTQAIIDAPIDSFDPRRSQILFQRADESGPESGYFGGRKEVLHERNHIVWELPQQKHSSETNMINQVDSTKQRPWTSPP